MEWFSLIWFGFFGFFSLDVLVCLAHEPFDCTGLRAAQMPGYVSKHCFFFGADSHVEGFSLFHSSPRLKLG